MNDNDRSADSLASELAALQRRFADLEAQLARRERTESLLHDATQSLRESEARLQFVLEGSRLGFWDWNIVTGDVKRNAYWAEMLGYTPDEVDDASAGGWLSLIHPDDRQRAWQSVEDNIAGRTTVHEVEYRMRTRDGGYRWILDRAQVVSRDAQGRALRMSGTHEDVTARKQMEDSLREARHTLEQRVEERTAELTHAMQVLQAEMEQRRQTEEELRQAKEAAESASRAKSEFLANMSHELRTPLTAILGYGELLELDPPPDERQSYLAVIQRNGQALLQLITDVLDLSKVEAGKLTIERRACDPRSVVAEVLNLVQLRAEEKHLSLAAEYREPLPATLVTDPVRLRQILVNLVGNAVKFTEVGRVQVGVSLAPGPPPQICFAVQDTGIGIAPDTVERMFLPFTQADASNTRRYGGSGLGLTISRRLADLIGGRLTATSRLGQGSTFTLTLPLEMPDHAAPCGAAGTPGIELARDLVPGGGRLHGRILLAEDVADTREFLRLTLASVGLEVDAVDNGLVAYRQALASAAEARPYDLILMDVQMPELNGLDATKQLRQLDWARPIVALTAHAMTGDRERCLAAGCDGYLTKPVTQRDLLETLARFLPSPAAPGEV